VRENRVLRRIFGPKMEKMKKKNWRKLHHEELPNLFSLPVTIGMMMSKRLRLIGRVPRMRRIGMHIEFQWESRKKIDN
jgi:hypothetical protein